MAKKDQPKRARLRRVSVRGELREEPDWEKFAWAALQYARVVNRQSCREPERLGESDDRA